MTKYILNTEAQIQEMLNTIGIQSIDQLYQDLPSALILKDELQIPKGQSEFAVLAKLKALAQENIVYKTILRGAGAEHHLIPAVVKQMSQREEFVTAYTPYQSEFSQGILQSIFEYQTSICELTGMDVSNASVYDGASAAAEAVAMVTEKNRRTILIPKNIHPDTRLTIETYTQFQDVTLVDVELRDGCIDPIDLKTKLNDQVAGVFIQNPNYFGLIEKLDELSVDCHQVGAKVIAIVHPTTLAYLKSPRAQGADIAVGEAQSLGIPLSFGGPYLGFMAASSELTRRIPGRIVGQTLDLEGKRAFALTLQAREQHIRREKASSSLCSNQALMALTASMYLAAMGPLGLQEVAVACLSKAHYFEEELSKIGFVRRHNAPFFHEFVSAHPKLSPQKIEDLLGQHQILSGLILNEKDVLWCVTESIEKAQLDEVIQILKEAL